MKTRTAKMKIGLVTPGGFDRSGTERVIPAFLWLVERLAQRDEVHVFTLYQSPQPEQYELLGATVHNIGYAGKCGPTANGLLRGLTALRREHTSGRFALLHGLWATESGLIAALAARLMRIPSVVTAMCGELIFLPTIGYGMQGSRKGRTLVQTTLRLASAVTSESEYARLLLSRFRPDAFRIPFGVDCSRFSPPAAPPIGPPWRLLHVASLNRVKDQATLLRAFARIHAAEPRTCLDIVGEDTLGGEIQRLARELLPAGAIHFHGFQSSDRVADRMRRSHLLLHSSLSEAAPVVFLEAAACGLPTVGTAVGLIDDAAPEAAVAVPVGDYATLANAALALLRDEGLRQHLGQRARDYARDHSADCTAARFEQLYLSLV